MKLQIEQEQLHGGGHASRGKSAGDIGCLRNFSIPIENVKVQHNVIQWWISATVKVIWCIFAIVSTISEILTFHIFTSKS